MKDGCISVVVVGAGNRSGAYTRYALSHPDKMKIVAIADPNPTHRRLAAERFGIPAGMQFESHDDIVRRPGLADAVLNCTREGDHHRTALPLLKAGYNMLLEKPIAVAEQEVREIIAAAQKYERTVMICHVLRYAPFYAKVKQLVADGVVGDLVALHTLEAVDYAHIASVYVRDRWHRVDRSGPMLLLKCCHDLDIIAWLVSGVPAARVASMGSRTVFRRENAPEGSGDRCLTDCRIERECPYSARRLYVERNAIGGAVWQALRGVVELTSENKEEYLRTTSPYGRCVWRCDNDQVDHQSVAVEFANGVTATHDMFGATCQSARRIHIVGTKGEIEGDMGTGVLRVRHMGLETKRSCIEETVSILGEAYDAERHGGGDDLLIADFVALLRGDPTSKGVTCIEDSLTGHLIAFAADIAMREGRTLGLSYT